MALAVWAARVNRDALRASHTAVHQAVALQVAHALTQHHGQTRTATRAVGLALGRTGTDGQARLAAALAVVESDPTLTAVAVYDAVGTRVDVVRTPDGAGVRYPASLPAEARAPSVHVWRPESGRYVVAPITRADAPGAPARGYVAAALSLAPVTAALRNAANESLSGDQSRVAVLHADGEVALATTSLRLSKALRERVLEDVSAGALSAPLLKTDVVTERGGAAWLSTLQTVPSAGLAVLVRTPMAELASDARAVEWRIGAFVLAALAAALSLALWLARRWMAPLGPLMNYVRALGARVYDAPEPGRGDDELGILGGALVTAAHDLRDGEAQLLHAAAVRQDFERYLPSEVVDAIGDRTQNMELGGARRVVTVLFADVAQFTPVAESLAPEQSVELLNELFTVTTEIVFRERGMVDKFIGDCVMAVWGAVDDAGGTAANAEPAPVQPPSTAHASTEHALAAMRAARDMQRWLRIARRRWLERYGVDIEIAIGVATGEALVGNVGSKQRMAFTAIGESVNRAARLEGAAQPGQVLFDAATHALVGTRMKSQDLGPQTFVGSDTSVTVHALDLT